MNTSQPSLIVQDVAVRYNNGHEALHDVTFSLEKSTICALLGVNGSGKSTLFKSIMGLINPKGSIKLCGLPVRQALKQKFSGIRSAKRRSRLAIPRFCV